MPTFNVQVSQNPYLARGADLVHAVVSIVASPGPAAAKGAGQAPGVPPPLPGTARAGMGEGRLAEAILLDCSGSMDGEKLLYAKRAVQTAVGLLRDDAYFCVVAGNDRATVLMPLAPATTANKQAAAASVARLDASGGTSMSTWLDAARAELRKSPHCIHHALLLTDGKNESEPESALSAAVGRCEGLFQCDARGVGTDWVPDQLRMISTRLLGNVDIIPSPDQIEADFRAVMASAMGKSLADVALRLWAPLGAQVEFCRLVYPQNLDLTARARVDPGISQVRDYPTGSWGEEKRDYHVAIRVKPGNVGQRMCAGRVSLISRAAGQELRLSEAMVLAVWTDDEMQSTVINPAVAHYTGQAELADTIQQGLKARAAGDEQRATSLLGRAVQIASETNPETMKLLRKVVQVEDEKQGTVKLIRSVRKEDEFALDTRSTKTVRVKKPAS
jgi:hypothetical protein